MAERVTEPYLDFLLQKTLDPATDNVGENKAAWQYLRLITLEAVRDLCCLPFLNLCLMLCSLSYASPLGVKSAK